MADFCLFIAMGWMCYYFSLLKLSYLQVTVARDVGRERMLFTTPFVPLKPMARLIPNAVHALWAPFPSASITQTSLSYPSFPHSLIYPSPQLQQTGPENLQAASAS